MSIDRQQVQREWEARGFSCDLWTDPPGQQWENFVHSVDELLTVIQGMLEVEVDGRTWRPEHGQEVFIPAHAVHSVRNVGTTQAQWLYGYKFKAP